MLPIASSTDPNGATAPQDPARRVTPLPRPVSIVQRFEIDAGHRLRAHRGKCANYHGHRYAFEVALQAPTMDAQGMVLDFGEVKRLLAGWFDEHWDHGMILQRGDPMIAFLLREHYQRLAAPPEAVEAAIEAVGHSVSIIASPKLYVIDTPPTAENLVVLAYEKCVQELAHIPSVRVVQVTLFETPNCRAVYPAIGART